MGLFGRGRAEESAPSPIEVPEELKGRSDEPRWEYFTLVIEEGTKYQYAIRFGGEEYRIKDVNDLVNAPGREGWELIGAVPYIRGYAGGCASYTELVHVFFKRPIR